MDSLKMAYGVKTPLHHKEDRIKSLPDQQMRYYPVDARGNLDEWGAIVAHQSEVNERKKVEEQVQYRQHQASYKQELDQAVRQKNQARQITQASKIGERQSIYERVQYDDKKEKTTIDMQVSQKRQYGEEAKQLILQKRAHQQTQIQIERNYDKQMVE